MPVIVITWGKSHGSLFSASLTTPQLCHQQFVHEITFATRFKVGLDSVPIPEFAVYHDLFFDPFPNPFCVLVLSHETKVASAPLRLTS